MDVLGGQLSWAARIDYEAIEADSKRVNAAINSTIDNAKRAGDVQAKAFDNVLQNVTKANQATLLTSNSIETLRAKLLAKKDFLITERDLSKIGAYNQEIETLEGQIAKLFNAGKKGFDIEGNPVKTLEGVGGAAEKAAGKTNVLAKSFSAIKFAANLLPGLGVAGIFALIADGAIALVKTLFDGGKAIDTFAAKYRLMSDVVKEANKDAGAQISTLKILYNAATDVNLSMDQRVGAVKALKEQFPSYFGDINNEIILNGQAKTSYDQLSASIIASARAKAAKAKLDEIEGQRLDISFQKQKIVNATNNEKAAIQESTQAVVNFNRVSAEERKKFSDKELLERQKATEKRYKQEEIDRRKEKALREQDKKDAELAAQSKFLTAFVGEANITKTVVDESTKRAQAEEKTAAKRAGSKYLKEYNDLLREREQLEKDIQAVQRDSNQSGLLREETAVDRVRERYELLIQRVEDYNKKAGKAKSINIEPIREAQRIEIDNTIQKQEADKYLQAISSQREAFTKFEEYKLQFGTDKARLLTGEQIKEFDSYVDYLKAELKSLEGNESVGARTKIIGLAKELEKANRDAQLRQSAQLAKSTTEVLNLTADYYTKSSDLAVKYHKLRDALEKASTTMTGEEYQNRLRLLNEQKEEEYKALDASVTRQSSLYKRLGQDTINLSKVQIREEIAFLEKELKNNKNLTPQIQVDIKSGIDKLKGLIDSSEDATDNLEDLLKAGGQVAGAFSSLASSVRNLNANLADSLDFVSGLIGGLTQAAGQLKDFNKAKAKGDGLEQLAAGANLVSTAVSVVSSIINTFKASADSKRDAAQQMKDFQAQAVAGEAEYNQMLRERARLQAGSNKLTLEAIQAQRQLLAEQQKSTKAEADRLLKQLQGEQFISGQTTKKTGGSGALGLVGGLLGFGKKTEIQNQLASLAGMTFEEIEKLYKSGRLTDQAKTLFEQLLKIKQEGADVDAMLAETNRRAAEIFTGTTADTLSNSIREGLKNGYKSVQDFAAGMEEMFREAILSGFEAKVIEERMQEFYKLFAEAAESNGGLDQAEIAALKASYEQQVQEILNQFDQLQSVTGVGFGQGSGGGNSIQGAIKGITEQQADLLAGQFGGLRLTAIESLNVSKSALQAQLAIENNTALTVIRLEQQTQNMYQWFMVQGIKIQ